MSRSKADWIVGVDIGGTNIKVGVVPFDGGTPLAVRVERTEVQRGAKFVVDRVVKMIQDAIEEVAKAEGAGTDAFAGIGIGSPGPLDRRTGTVISTPNLGWRNFPLRDLIRNAVGLPATLDNDANAATYGEWWQGAGRDVDTVVGVTLGTGIGGGIVLNGVLHHGASDAAGELGHMTIDSTGRKCNCGNYGCLEAYASGPAIAARAIEGLEAEVPSLLPELAGDPNSITAETVYDAVVQGDPYATEVLHDTAKFLGVGLANIINIINPDLLVISGGVTKAGDHLFEPLRAEIRKRAFRVAEQACKIVPSSLNGTAGIIGAVACFKKETYGSV
ncbi:MAG: ROK family protein [Gemmatimonadetes bacterium]|uniref:ROK family protein n=1 Tax=Candidatus Kutchimonas denitrificans TaxID=3056748 RepID=A0AAE4Z849_9BACT|nr:ROK family protein [Gemmatimonadota bacterium]NIR75575.1 ROK family protein [Candidatus Kutchimonas denitrificans]NIS01889.1 ROK family protein [Gemmatimonadota bacterium]NIT67670.1 ROK family protein [Gemmatimonadota bacterium]NIU53544.1 ROK family protein [Gemmatimonadota bacterium]